MTAFCHRFHPAVIELKKLIDAGTLGRPVLFRNIFVGYVKLSGNHRMNPKVSGGGCLIDHCSHSVDLFRYLVGEPTVVAAQAGVILQDTPIEDFGMIQLRSGPRVFGEITASYSILTDLNRIEWNGTLGGAVVNYFAPGQPDLVYKTVDTADWVKVDCSAHPDRFTGEVRHFLDCVRTGQEPMITVEDGLKANRIVDAAYESVKTGRAVKLGKR